MSARDGGPAFPAADHDAQHRIALVATMHIEDPYERESVYAKARARAGAGMTLRDYFAAKALHGLLHAESHGDYSNEHIAVIAYMLADAMLKAREVQP